MFRNTRVGQFVVAFAVLFAACSGSSDDTASAPGESDSTSDAPTEVVTTPLAEITANHVDPPVSFDTSPSTGGDHFGFWHNCGFYSEELIEGAATHSLEHGAIWITYGESLDDEGVAALESLAAGNPRLLISPYDHDEPIVLSAWGAQQRGIQSATAPEIDAFITDWIDNPELIEAGASCNGAVGVPPDDPNSLIDGTPVPEAFLS